MKKKFNQYILRGLLACLLLTLFVLAARKVAEIPDWENKQSTRLISVDLRSNAFEWNSHFRDLTFHVSARSKMTRIEVIGKLNSDDRILLEKEIRDMIKNKWRRKIQIEFVP